MSRSKIKAYNFFLHDRISLQRGSPQNLGTLACQLQAPKIYIKQDQTN
jgi:hypothetical protein